MARSFPAILFTFALFGLTVFYAKTADITTSKPVPLQASLEGNSLAVTKTTADSIAFAHPFPFTDKRMKMNQAKFEKYIEEFIIMDLEESQNVTQAAEKYPQNSPVYLNIDTKYAYHALIDEFGIGLYTFKYDLTLNSCGPSVKSLKMIGYKHSKGDLFNTQTILNRKYRTILERLIRESSQEEKQYKEQEIPLLITVHPELTFVPAAIVEDRLENLRVNFPELNVRYCTHCSNILPYHEYAYLSWMTVSNGGILRDDSFFKPQEQNMINIGFGSKAIFSAYPVEIAIKSNEDDKLSTHTYCVNNKREVNAFAQNAYYARSLEQFTHDFLMFTTKAAHDKLESQNSEVVKVEWACYPRYYKEKLDIYNIVGTGYFEKCRIEIEEYINLNYVPSESNHNFDLPQDKMPWPLENLKESLGMVEQDIKVYIESTDLETLFSMSGLDSNAKSVTMDELNRQIETSCTEILEEGGPQIKQELTKKDYLERCIHLIYINTLLKQTGMTKDKNLYIRNRAVSTEMWMKGLTIRHIENFHSLEKEWFDGVQDRALEAYLLKLGASQELELQKSMYLTFGLIMMLAMTFWIGFIVRFRNIETNEPGKEVKKH